MSGKINDVNKIFKRKIQVNNYFFPSKEDELILLITRYFIEKRGRQLKYIVRMKELNEDMLDLNYINSQSRYNLIDKFKKIIDKKITIIDHLEFKLFNWNFINSLLFFIKKEIIRKYLLLERGRIIVFNGVDGSGKTTITKLLNKQIPYNTKRIYLGRNLSESRIFFIKWIVGFVERFSNTPLYKLVRLIRYPFSLLDEILRIIKIRYLLLKGTMILSDRYIYESVLEENKGLATKIKSLFLYFYPKPDLFVLLDVDPKIAYERKRENTIEQLEINRKKLLEFTKKEFPNNSTIITNKNIEQTKEQVLLKICDLYK